MKHNPVSQNFSSQNTRSGAGIFCSAFAIGSLFVAAIVVAVSSERLPMGEPGNPLPGGRVELVLFEGNGTFHAPKMPDDSQQPRRKIWLSQNHRVELLITSADYVYALNQPDLGVNVVAVPGLRVSVDLEKMPLGSYELSSNPICGTPWNHSDPPSTIVIVP